MVSIPQADLTLILGTQYELDLPQFHLNLKAIEASEEGIVFDDIHTQLTAEVVLGGITFAKILQVNTPYTVTFEDLQYKVDLVNANSNVKDRSNDNQVSVGSQNSAGLVRLPLLDALGILLGGQKDTDVVVTPTGRTAGPIVQTFAVAGATVTIKRTS